MKQLTICLCVTAGLLAQVTYAQSTGWVMWLERGNLQGTNWSILDAFDEFAGCQKLLDAKAAGILQLFPKVDYDLSLSSSGNAHRTINAIKLLTEEQKKNAQQTPQMTTMRVICLPGETNPPK